MLIEDLYRNKIDRLGKKVLFVAPDTRWKGGISSVINEYKQAITTFQYQPSTTSENIVVTFISFPFLLANFCGQLIAKRHVKIVHIHGASKGSFYRKYIFFILARYGFRKKVIYHIHGAMYHLFYQRASSFEQKRIKHFINSADCLIVLSDWWKNFFEKEFTPHEIRVIPNIVKATEREEVAHSVSSPLKFLFLGRIGERKGVYDLLEVLGQHRAELADRYKLALGGDGEVKKLQKLIKDYRLEDSVQYVGFVTGHQKKQLMKSADVYILPSYHEGLPISILEAMSFGMPIISTGVGGIPEVVQPHQNGLLVSAGDQTAIFEAIRFFLDHPEKIKEYGARSYDMVARKYFPKPVMESLAALYEELLS